MTGCVSEERKTYWKRRRLLAVATSSLFLQIGTDDDGAWILAGAWPAGLSSAGTVYFQAWFEDAAGPQGWAASNALGGTPPF